MADQAISPLRRRMIEDMTIRKFAPKTQASYIHAVLDRHGLVKHMGKKRQRANGTPLSAGLAPNDLWCAD